MKGSLLRVLISKKFFDKGTEVDAVYRGPDLSGANIVNSFATFTVANLKFIGVEEVAMEGINIVDGSSRIFYACSLIKIDGMDPIRFAASNGIDENGEKIKEGKRRGRKPKNRAILVEQEDDNDDLDIMALEDAQAEAPLEEIFA